MGLPHFSAFFQTVPGRHLVLLPDRPAYTIVAANSAYAQALHTEPDELVGRALCEAVGDTHQLRASLDRVLAAKTKDAMPVQKHRIVRPPDGGGGFEERYWAVVNSPLLGEDGQVQFIVHSAEDAADHPQTHRGVEQDLRLMEARFSLAFDLAPVGMVLLSPEGHIATVNQAFLDMLGYTREEIGAGNSARFTHPDDRELTRNFFASLREGPHTTGAIEKRYFRKNGELLWTKASATMRRDDQGAPIQVIAMVEDITARKQAEARYRFLAETIPQMVWTATPDGMLDYVNGQGCAYFDVAQQALLGAGWLQWVHPEERAEAVKRWSQSLKTGEPYEGSFRLKRGSDQSWRCHIVRARAHAGEQGDIVQWFGTCTDIEEEKVAEAHLLQQWHTFDTALSHTPDFTYIFDLEGRFTYVNRALLSLWQKPLEEAVGKNFFELDYPPALAGKLQRQIQQVIETKDTVRDQTPFTGPSGETRHYDYIFVPIFAPDGHVEAVAGSTRDITEREQLQTALIDSEERLRGIFAQAPVAIVVFRGPDFVVELANPPYQALLPGRELVGRPFAESVPELGQHVWNALNSVFETGHAFIANDFLSPYDSDLDGIPEDHWFNVVYHPLKEPGGRISGVVAVLTEVTAQVRDRQNLERANKELEEFAHVSSHDLQEPLRMVNIYTQLLIKRCFASDETAMQYAQFISGGVKRMEELIRDLLSYSQAIHVDGEPAVSADLSQSLAEALQVLKSHIEEIDATVTAAPLPLVHGDTTQLAHVFQNLLSNSLKYRKKDVVPSVHISAELTADRCIVSVTDNGIGFEAQYEKRIFGLFKRLHKDEYPGTGLGLAICQRIVERYGGRMWAEGKPGVGATFFFDLPRVHVP